jgi:hypothetical protein
LLTRGWIVACIVAALFVLDQVERRHYRPLCVEACADTGDTLLDVRTGSNGRGSMLDNSVRCTCSNGKHVTLYTSWGDCVLWFARLLGVAVFLAGIVALARWLWRRRARDVRDADQP